VRQQGDPPRSPGPHPPVTVLRSQAQPRRLPVRSQIIVPSDFVLWPPPSRSFVCVLSVWLENKMSRFRTKDVITAGPEAITNLKFVCVLLLFAWGRILCTL